MQQGILAKLTLTSRYRSGHDPTRTKTSPRCAEGYHPTRTKYELVGEQEENELFQSSLRMGGHARKMRVGTGVVKGSSTLFYSQEVDLGRPFPTNG